MDHQDKIVDFSQSQFSDTQRTSIFEGNSEIFPIGKGKLRHISFVSPNKLPNTQSFVSAHTRSGSSILTPNMKSSFNISQDLRSKESSLKKLDEKLNRITEEFASARNSDRFPLRETGFETERMRDFNSERIYDSKDSKYYLSTERSTMARVMPDEYELTDHPVLKWCAYCTRETTTEITFRNTTKTFMSSLGIFLFGGFLGCFLLPYMTNSCKEMKSVCHVCKREIGFN